MGRCSVGAAAALLLALPLVGCASEAPHRRSPAATSFAPRARGAAPLAANDGVEARARPRPADDDPAAALARAAHLDLGDLLRAAERLNPQIAAAREELAAAGGRTQQAGLYPNPFLELEAEEIPERGVRLGRSNRTIGISQRLILGSRRRDAVSAATADEQVRRLELDTVRRAVLAELRAAHGEALALRASAAAHAELLDIAARTLEVARARFEARAAPESEVLRAELEQHELQLGARRLEQESGALVARLRALLGGAPVRLEQLGDAPPAAPTPVDAAQLLQLVVEGHPELAAARAAVEAADLRVDAAEAESVPDLTLGLGYGHDRQDRDILELGVRFALPVFDRNQGRVREAKHLAARARRELEAVRGRLESELAAALAAHAVARDQLDTFRERIVPATERALSQVRASYAAGRTGMLDLLDAQRTHARARLSLIQGLRDAAAAEARLWRFADLDPQPTASPTDAPRPGSPP